MCVFNVMCGFSVDLYIDERLIQQPPVEWRDINQIGAHFRRGYFAQLGPDGGLDEYDGGAFQRDLRTGCQR